MSTLSQRENMDIGRGLGRRNGYDRVSVLGRLHSLQGYLHFDERSCRMPVSKEVTGRRRARDMPLVLDQILILF